MRMCLYLVCLISAIFVVHGQSYGRSRTRPVPTNPEPAPTCRWGSTGPCHGNRCPAGSTCQRNPWSNGGTCCINRRETPECQGTCGGFVGAPCRPGYTCIRTGGSSLGNCCRTNQPRCPPYEGGRPIGRRCDPNVNCYRDNECPGTAKCCAHDRCGKVCKYPVVDPRW